MSSIKEVVILHIKKVIAVILNTYLHLITPNNPEIQEYFQEYFLLFFKIQYIILENTKGITSKENKSSFYWTF